MMQSAVCWIRRKRLHGDPCSGRMQKAHLIPKRRMKGLDWEDIWDRRVWVWICEHHHQALDGPYLTLNRNDYPPSVLDWALDHGFYWNDERKEWRREWQRA
jgi:hypothetical protein